MRHDRDVMGSDGIRCCGVKGGVGGVLCCMALVVLCAVRCRVERWGGVEWVWNGRSCDPAGRGQFRMLWSAIASTGARHGLRGPPASACE